LNYDKGQTVYIGLDHVDPYRRRNENIRVPVVIESGFLGRDGREWYVYERPSKDGNLCHYGVAPYDEGPRLCEAVTATRWYP
jgi:hypothetical protein